MLGLFGTLNLGARSLATQQQGSEIAGQNLANVNNPAYARQRLAIATSMAVPSAVGPQGTGVDSVAIVQLRNLLLDRQITSETSVTGSLSAQQLALQNAESNFGEQIDSSTSGTEGASATGSIGSKQGLATSLSDLFSAFQSLSTDPSSMTQRQVLLQKAQSLATQFNQVSSRLDSVRSNINDSIQNDVDKANQTLSDIAKLNDQIITSEAASGGTANDLRDLRQQKLEDLSKIANVTATAQPNGGWDIAIGGITMVSGKNTLDSLQTYDAGGGQILLKAANVGTPLTLTGGSIQGNIEVREGALAKLQNDTNTLATQLITQVNAVHGGGFDLNGATGQNFFSGTDAATISVNSALLADPSRIQASGVAGATGDNKVAVALAQLANSNIAGLNNQTFNESYSASVASLGQSLSSINDQIANHDVVNQMLQTQRSSESGVSLDEEMTDLMKYQKAFQASARLITTVSDMLDTVVNLK
jgi:flagellar hook-associated protein 1